MKYCSARIKNFFSDIKECFIRYFELHIGGSAAEMSYYFLFSVFPLIMATSAVTLMRGTDEAEVISLFESLFPNVVYDLLTDFYNYIASQNNTAFFSMGLFLALCAITRYINCTKMKIREIYSSNQNRGILHEWFLSFVFSFFIVVGLYLTFFFQIVGEGILDFFSERIFFISETFISSWLSLRFIAIGIYVFILLLLTYKTIPSRGLSFRSVLGGAVFSTAAWLIVSVLFSFYVDNIANYSAIYGSIGAFIVLMLWLFIINNIILTGALINKVFAEGTEKRSGKKFM